MDKNFFPQTFSSFLYNKKNSHTIKTVKDFLTGQEPDLLIVSGNSGSGKSHILNAARIFLQETKPAPHLMFVQTSSYNLLTKTSFTNIIENSEKLNNSNFLGYMLVDNFPAEEINKFISYIYKKVSGDYPKKQRYLIAITGNINDCPSINIQLNERSHSIYSVKLSSPDLDVRIRYTTNISNYINLNLKNEYILEISRKHDNLKSIYSHLTKKQYKLNKIRPLTKNKKNISNNITPNKIISHVADYFQLKTEQIKSASRLKKIVLARQISMYMCKNILDISLSFIGKCFENKNHASVLYSINKINILYKSNKNMHNLISELEKFILKK